MIGWMEWHAELNCTKNPDAKRNVYSGSKGLDSNDFLNRAKPRTTLRLWKMDRWTCSIPFGASRLSARVRLAECGFELVKGAFIYIDGSHVPTHRWKSGYLKDTQTFSVSLIQFGLTIIISPNLKGSAVERWATLCRISPLYQWYQIYIIWYYRESILTPLCTSTHGWMLCCIWNFF